MILTLVPIIAAGVHRRGENLRQRILDLVDEEPGIHLARAARILGVPANSLHFHVRRLVRTGQVTASEQGKTLHLFLPVTPEHEQTWRIALADPAAQALAELATARRGIGIEEAARVLGQSRKVVRKHMLRMASEGLLSREPGHHGKFAPTALLLDATWPRAGKDAVDDCADPSTGRDKRPRLPEFP